MTMLDAPAEAADAEAPDPDAPDRGVPCFDLEGYRLQITDLSGEKDVRWIRWRQKAE